MDIFPFLQANVLRPPRSRSPKPTGLRDQTGFTRVRSRPSTTRDHVPAQQIAENIRASERARSGKKFRHLTNAGILCILIQTPEGVLISGEELAKVSTQGVLISGVLIRGVLIRGVLIRGSWLEGS